ncbi:MAG: hypothetical protein D3909_19680, partial [Candidatus Electrothrix sp. ATG1]|nr:hypothetical protein [Candidatus Electrothrix sp. ATG1]
MVLSCFQQPIGTFPEKQGEQYPGGSGKKDQGKDCKDCPAQEQIRPQGFLNIDFRSKAQAEYTIPSPGPVDRDTAIISIALPVYPGFP